MSAKRSYLAAALAPLLTVPAAAVAQQPLPDAVYDDLNQAIIRDQIAPVTVALATEADALAAAMQTYCAAPGTDSLDAAQAAFHAVYDRWMTVSWVNFGPQVLLMRPMRLHFWPDSRNTLGRQLSGVLNTPREDLLEQETLAQASVALQGLPALERLLFEETPVAGDDYACDLAVAIAGNVQGIAAGLAAGWNDADHLAATLPDGAALTTNLFQSVFEHLELIVTRKIEPVLGASAEDGRPRLAENWRSERALRNIVMNLTAMSGALENADATGFTDVIRDEAEQPQTAAALVGSIEEALTIARSLEGRPVAEILADEAGRADLIRLAAAVDTARGLWMSEVGAALGLSVGFNRLDGD